MLLPDAGITFLKNVLAGGWRDLFFSFKIAFYYAVYRAMVDYYVYRGQQLKKIDKKIKI
jgi:hypothetical protein